jgi:hypothetical protein
MSVRYRWFRVQMPRKDADLRSLLLRHPLREDSQFGFRLGDPTLNSEGFQFLWRSAVVVTRINDDFSPVYEQIASINLLTLATITINRMQFLRVENPGRNLRDLMNAMESVVGLGFSCRTVTFEGVRHDDFLRKGIDAARIVGLRIVGVADGDVLVRMDFASKKGIDPKELRALKGVRYRVELAGLQCTYRVLKGLVSIATGGSVRFSGPLTPRLVSLFEKELPALVKVHDEDAK